mmetsp:Transcript_7374/g.21346  ORF Transcript_7374/g.21346 Transcript_7374/m.21346 type:complete len:413 (-) Transcript_7374:316-1554(-)
MMPQTAAHLLFVVRGLLLLGGLLEPLDEGLHVPEEHLPALWAAALLLPNQDGILRDDVGVVEELDDLREELQDGGVLVAVLLDRVHQLEFLPRSRAVGLEQLDPGPQQLDHGLVGLLLGGRLVGPLHGVHDAPPHDGQDVHHVELEFLDLRGGDLQALLHAALLLDVGLELVLQQVQVRVTEALLVELHELHEAGLGEVGVEVVDRPLLLREEGEHLVVQSRPLEEHVELLDGVLAQELLAELSEELKGGALVNLGVVKERLHHLLRERAELHVEDEGGGNRQLRLARVVEELELPQELAQGGLQPLHQEGLLPHDHLHEPDVRDDLLPRAPGGKDVQVQAIVLPPLVVARGPKNPAGEDDLKKGLTVPVVVQVGLVDAREGMLESRVYIAVSSFLCGREDIEQRLGERGGV